MRTVPASIATALQNDATAFAMLFTLKGKDNVERRFTSHDIGINFNGEQYQSWMGFTYSAFFNGLGANTSSVTISFLLDEFGDDDLIGISALDIRRGYMNEAYCTIAMVDWEQQNILGPIANASVRMFEGTAGVIKILDSNFASLEITAKTNLLNGLKNEVYSVLCRADFGDDRCKVDLDDLKRDLEVLTVVDNHTFTFDNPGDFTADELEDDYWRQGLVVWTTGNNALFPGEIIGSVGANDAVYLWLRTPFPIEVGDTFTIYPGCDKAFLGGCTRWDNKLNFRGEPFTGVAMANDSIVTPPTGDEKPPTDQLPSSDLDMSYLPIN